jgi:hypothetical protein
MWQILLQKSLMASVNSDSVALMRFAARRFVASATRLDKSSSPNWLQADRIDPIQARNLKEDRTLDAARAIGRLEEEARRGIGSSMRRMLQLVLGDRYRDPCPGQQRGSRATVAQVAETGSGSP